MKAIPALLGLFLIFDFAVAEDLDVLSFDDEEVLVEDVTSSVEPVSKEPVAATPEPVQVVDPVKAAEPAQVPEPAKVAEPTKAAEPVKTADPVAEKKDEKATEPQAVKEQAVKPVVEEKPIVPTPEPSETATIVSEPPAIIVKEAIKPPSCKDSPIVKKINTEAPSFGCFEILEDGKLKIKYRRQTASIERQALDVKVTCETPKTAEKTIYSFKTDKEKRILSVKSKKVSIDNPAETDLAKLDYDQDGKCIDVTNAEVSAPAGS